MLPFLSRKDSTQAARSERAKALYSAKCRKSVRKLLISVSFVHFYLIYIKKCKNVTLSWLNIWWIAEIVVILQRQKVNRLFRLVVIDLGF